MSDAFGRLEEQVEAAAARGDARAVLQLAEELLFGEPRLLNLSKLSAVAIRSVHQLHLAGNIEAGFLLVALSFEEISDFVPFSIEDWLQILIAKARAGDMGAVLEIEHLPLNIMPAAESERLVLEIRAALGRRS